MKIETPRLNLSPVAETDLSEVHTLLSLPETDEFNTLGIPDSIEVTAQTLADWIRLRDEPTSTKYVYSICNKAGTFMGLIGINIGKPKYKNAGIWYHIHPQYWNQGFATEAVKYILQFCFTNLHLHRIEAGAAIGNIASHRVLQKVGMTKEGHCRAILPIRGQWVDNYEFAILDTDFFAMGIGTGASKNPPDKALP